MFESGIAVGLGLLLSLAKMSWKWKLRILSNPLVMDAIVFCVLCVLHWGTFSGVMAATIGAGIVSIVISFGRWFVGYNTKSGFHPGVIDITAQRTAS